MRALLVVALLFSATLAEARVGFGDPASAWRDRAADQWLMMKGHLRLRGALYQGLDLGREDLWPAGANSSGGDLRLRLSPSFFLGETARVVVEMDLADFALGARPTGTPFGDRTAVVAATAFQEQIANVGLRSAYGEVLLPFGVLSAGRMPSHFGLGIASNAGDALDDDGGDRADRVAFTAPLFGHFLALGFDIAASGPQARAIGIAPAAGRPELGVYAASAALLRYHAPWEAQLYRESNRLLVDYGISASALWQSQDVPAYYAALAPDLDPALVVDRGASAGVFDLWARVLFGPLRVELEALASTFTLSNPSPWAGVTVRQPVTGNPFGAVLQVAYEPVDGAFSLVTEAGVASGDPAPGFPLAAPTSFAGAQPGDLFGSQLDGKRDARMDAFRFHPAYRVDLIMWRTLLGGVSEAAYARAKTRFELLDDLALEGNLIYSHGVSASSNPGGVAPLGAELDLALVGRFDHFSVRADWGGLIPLGGLGQRGQSAPPFAQILLLRLAYAY